MDTIFSQIAATPLIEWVATAAGLVGVYLSIKERILAWPFFIVCYGLYVSIAFEATLYAATVFNAGFIPISIYGWRRWYVSKKSRAEEGEGSGAWAVSHLTRAQGVAVLAIVAAGTLAFGALLLRFTEGAFPFLDAFATTLSFSAQWMLSRKHLENWLAWMVADLVFALLWGMQGYWLTVFMFLVFALLSMKGYFEWRGALKRGKDGC